MVELVRETNSLLKTIVIGAYLVGALFIVAGLAFVYMGAAGNTELSFFGQSLKSGNVGIAALFLGAATIVLLLRRSFSIIDLAVATEALNTAEKSSARPNVWPDEISVTSLSKALQAMSKQQWKILEVVEKSQGLSYTELAKRSSVGSSALGYRLDSLQKSKLIDMAGTKAYLAKEVIELCRSKGLALKSIRER